MVFYYKMQLSFMSIHSNEPTPMDLIQQPRNCLKRFAFLIIFFLFLYLFISALYPGILSRGSLKYCIQGVEFPSKSHCWSHLGLYQKSIIASMNLRNMISHVWVLQQQLLVVLLRKLDLQAPICLKSWEKLLLRRNSNWEDATGAPLLETATVFKLKTAFIIWNAIVCAHLKM